MTKTQVRALCCKSASCRRARTASTALDERGSWHEREQNQAWVPGVSTDQKKIAAYLPAQLEADVRAAAEADGQTLTELVRRALRRYLTERVRSTA